MSLPQRLLFCSFFLASQALWAQSLPIEVEAALARAKVPRDAISVLVVDAQGAQPARLSHRTREPATLRRR